MGAGFPLPVAGQHRGRIATARSVRRLSGRLVATSVDTPGSPAQGVVKATPMEFLKNFHLAFPVAAVHLRSSLRQ